LGHHSSWTPELSEEEMKIIEPLMEKIQQLRATPKKELSGIQLIQTFVERRVITHKYRGSCVAFLISKSVEPNEELKVG
jgi:hypothetical protein